jgi:Ca-activated chloride channel family protein
LLPVGPVDPAAFGRAVAGIKASGYTPIGRALQAAAQALPAEGPRSIVLVSDGEDTCAPPAPCDVAKELKAAGTDLIVHTIGFKVEAAARKQLSCMASATGGTYREVTDGAALAESLVNRVQRAITPYSAVGRPIVGGDSTGNAPELGPGQYLDTFARGGDSITSDGTIKYYAVRLRAGDTIHISATLIPPSEHTPSGPFTVLTVAADLVDTDDQPCGRYSEQSFDIGVFGKVTPQTAVLNEPPVGGKGWNDERCPAGSLAYVKITRRGQGWADRALPMEIALRLEPPVGAEGEPAVTARAAALPAPRETAPRAVPAGYSFNDAPELAPGTYSGSLVAGETLFSKVPVQWGQRLAYRVTLAAIPGQDYQGAAFYVNLASPLRENLEQSRGGVEFGFAGRRGYTLHGSALVPVRYANRSVPTAAIARYSVSGDHYLVLDATYPLGGKPPFTIPFRLTVAVEGTAETGPQYLSDPAGTTPATTTSATTTAASPAAAAGPAAPSEPTGSSIGWLPWLLGGVLVLLVAGFGAVAFVLGRRHRPVS